MDWQHLFTLSSIPGALLGIGGSCAVIYLFFTGAFKRTRVAAQDYEGTLVGNVNALKDRVALLERWRDEAAALDSRVRDLERKLRELIQQHAAELGERDVEIARLRDELSRTKSDLAAAHAKIRRLEKTVSANDAEVTA